VKTCGMLFVRRPAPTFPLSPFPAS
jgi:hypothetical protein